MQRLVLYFLATSLLYILNSCNGVSNESDDHKNETMQSKVEYAMVIHGGAGTITRDKMSDKLEQQYRAALDTALMKGQEILKSGGSGTEAVVAAISYMEDSPLFNAGRGAVFTNSGTNELDASIMRGDDLQAGAVGALTNVKNPVKAAVAVMNNSEHVFLSGPGAEEFAFDQGLETVDPEYFHTDKRWNSLQKIKAKEESLGVHITDLADSKYGTVGAVALDKNGNIVAATSTGGMTNKKYGRIGDSPIIGAGTYANNASCGVSCTGHGEYFIRYAVAHDMHAQMAYGGKDVSQAGEHIINQKLKEAGGSGGLIALDRYGNISMPFNSEGMYRGYVTDKEKYIGIYKDE